MMEDDQSRALSVYWLDSGRHPARSIALKNGISVKELECELSIFKSSEIYQSKYAPIIEQDIVKALVNYPFHGWNKHICMRILPNDRIECIIADTRYDRKFYHAYLPDKEFVTEIFLYSVFVCEQDFYQLAGIKGQLQWKALSVDQQLNLLLDFYDSEVVIPYRRLITKGEKWIREYTGFDVTPISYTKRSKQFPSGTLELQKDICINNGNVPVVSSQEKSETAVDTTITLSEMIQRKIAVWKDITGKILRQPLSSMDIIVLREKMSQTDRDRLEHLYAEGLDTLSSIEKNVFVHIDPFYTSYGLKDSILLNSEIQLHDMLNKILAELSGREYLSEIAEEERSIGKKNFRQILQILLDDKKTDTQKNTEVIKLQHFLNEYSRDDSFIEELWQILINIVNPFQIPNLFVDEVFQLMDELGYSKEELEVTEIEKPVLAVSGHLLEPDFSTEVPKEGRGNSIHEHSQIATMNQRSQLLMIIEKEGIREDLIMSLQKTEDEISVLPPLKWPVGYPEKNRLLYALYWSNKIKTVSEVLSYIIKGLSAEEIAVLYKETRFLG